MVVAVVAVVVVVVVVVVVLLCAATGARILVKTRKWFTLFTVFRFPSFCLPRWPGGGRAAEAQEQKTAMPIVNNKLEKLHDYLATD